MMDKDNHADDLRGDVLREVMQRMHTVMKNENKLAESTPEMLRARIADLEAQLEAVGAGGVQPLQQGAATASDAEIDNLTVKHMVLMMGGESTHEPCADMRPVVRNMIRAVLARWGTPQAAELPERVPLTPDQVGALLTRCGYDEDTHSGVYHLERATFINGLRHGERLHGITSKPESKPDAS